MINLSNFSSIFIANWKLNGNIEFIDEYYQNLLPNNMNCVVICSPNIFLSRLKFNNNNLFKGAQNVSVYNEGPYTGEVSAKMLVNENVKFCIVGHSERRQYFHETNEDVNTKSTNLIKNNIIPIICVGETLEEKEKKLTKSVLTKQLKESVPDIANNNNVIIAYEPIWAIGTGLTPSIDEIEEVHGYIRSIEIKFKQFKILYGGSVKASNSADIVNLHNVSGCLVGGSSLNTEEFNKIIS